MLHRVEGIDQRILTFHPKFQSNFVYEPDEVYDAFHEYISVYDEAEEIELIHHIIAKGTIDEDVMAALARKERVQNALINAVKAKLEVRA